MSWRDDPNFLTPGAGETLEFTNGNTVSGVLIPDEIYRLAVDNSCWVELDDGGGGMVGADGTAMLIPSGCTEFIRTTDDQYVLHALGVTTSGICNYIHMKG